MPSANKKIETAPFDYATAFSRNLGLLDESEQHSLSTKRVGLPGCGGVGGNHAMVLARLGIGSFVLADFDRFEIGNFNRQFGAKVSNVGREKTEVIAQEILGINPNAKVQILSQGISADNVDAFIGSVDLIVDGLDFFAFDAREMLFNKAWEAGVPLLTAAPLGFSCALLLFDRNSKGATSPKDYFGFVRGDDSMTRALKFMVGLSPKGLHLPYMHRVDLGKGRGPSSSIGVSLCAAMAGAEAVKILLGRGGLRPAPCYTQFDAYRGKLCRGKVLGGSANPAQWAKRWLARRKFSRVGGSNAV